MSRLSRSDADADAEGQPYVGELAGRGGVQRRVEEVEEPVRHLGGRAAGGDRADRGGQGEVAGQDARRPAERRGGVDAGAGGDGAGVEGAAHVGPAAADVVAVDDVVVDDEGGVEELDRGTHLDGRGGDGPAERVVGGGQQLGAEALAALGGGGQGVPEPGVLGVGGARAGTALLEQPPQGLVGGAWAHWSSNLVTRGYNLCNTARKI